MLGLVAEARRVIAQNHLGGLEEVQSELERKIEEIQTRRFDDSALLSTPKSLQDVVKKLSNDSRTGASELLKIYQSILNIATADQPSPPPVGRAGKQEVTTEANYAGTLQELHKYLADSSNPYVVKRIAEIFQSITVVDGVNGILAKFPRELLPELTYKLIAQFDDQIKVVVTNAHGDGAVRKVRRSIKDDFAVLAKIKPRHATLMPKLDQLLSLDAALAWENLFIEEIIRQTKEGSLAALESYVCKTLSQSAKDKIEQELQKRGLPSLKVLISEIFTRALYEEPMVRARDENTEKHDQERLRRNLETEFDRLCETLSTSPALLEQITINLVHNRLVTVDQNIQLPEELTNRLTEVSQMHQRSLHEALLVPEILKRAALRAIQTGVAPRQANSVLIEKAMELLRQAHTQVENMRGTIALFMGPTNSGKSSAIAFCQGAKFEEAHNEGESIYVLSPLNHDNAMYPKIGLRLGISETLYATPWNVRVNDTTQVTFVDAAGEYDTRGETYTLCANLSLDLAVLREAGEVGALVITVPCSAFSEDNGSSFLRLMKLIKGRFPACFDLDAPQRQNVYLLITKWKNVTLDALRPIFSGRKIQAYIEQIESELERQEQQQMVGTQHHTNETMSENRSIWKFFQSLLSNKQVYQFNPGMPQDRAEVVEAIYDRMRRPGLKASYVSAMRTDDMQRQFGDIIVPSAETWATLLENYSVTVMRDIEGIEGQIQRIQTRLQELQQQTIQRAEDIQRRTQEIEAAIRLIQNLENVEKDPSNTPADLKSKLPAIAQLAALQDSFGSKQMLSGRGIGAALMVAGATIGTVVPGVNVLVFPVFYFGALSFFGGAPQEGEIEDLTASIKMAQMTLADQIRNSLREEQQRQTTLIEQRTAFERQQGLDDAEFQRIMGELPDLQSTLERHRRVKRNLAIVLIIQNATIRVLNSFVDHALNGKGLNAQQERQRLQAACDRFRRFYQNDDHFNNIIEECRRYLFP